MTGKPRVTVSAVPVVVVHIRGEPREPQPGDVPPRCPDDGGKVRALLDWFWSAQIYGAIRGGYSGGGGHLGFYAPADAKRILAKCTELGIEQVSYEEQDA